MKNFNEYVSEFDSFHDVIKTKEWQEFYSRYYELSEYEMDIKINETLEEIENYSEERQLEERIKCSESFQYFAHKYLKIQHGIETLPFILYKYQSKAVDGFNNNSNVIVSKCRQGGFTTLLSLWALWKTMFQENQNILFTTAFRSNHSVRVIELATHYLPSWMKPETLMDETSSTLAFHHINSAITKDYSLIIFDDAAHMPNLKRKIEKIGANIIAVSSSNGSGNWFARTYNEPGDFHVINFDFWENPKFNSPEWINTMQSNMGIYWSREILRSFV